ncbi:MAG: AAA family ATPase [Acidimicrobiales bacterium]
MAVSRLEVAGYRSLQDVALDLAPLTVIAGPNGSGKSNLYRALQLAHSCGTGELARRIALEGGMLSILWAGRRKGEPKVQLSVQLDHLTYDICLATMARGASGGYLTFPLDPVITTERLLRHLPDGPPAEMLDRFGTTAFLRDDEGHRVTFPAAFRESEPVLSQLIDPVSFPELVLAREALGRMRFHHQLRTDDAAPARQPTPGTRTFAVDDEGPNLAAALKTIQAEGDRAALDHCLAVALGGAKLEIVEESTTGRLEIQLNAAGTLFRPMRSSELSDGQLRFLFLAAALLAVRPPDVLVLNEPESSLHADLLVGLARLVAAARERDTQVIITTHSRQLADVLCEEGAELIELQLSSGATVTR